MAQQSKSPPASHSDQKAPLWLRIGFWTSIVIAIAVVIRRIVALAVPTRNGPPQMSGLDDVFASHTAITLAHILPALFFVLLACIIVFRPGIRPRWIHRAFYSLGAITGLTAYAMSLYPIGGWTERSAVLFFDTLFLFSLARAFIYPTIRLHPNAAGCSAPSPSCSASPPLRPVMGVFFATARLTHLLPHSSSASPSGSAFPSTCLVLRTLDRFRRSRPAHITLANPELPHKERDTNSNRANRPGMNLKHPSPPPGISPSSLRSCLCWALSSHRHVRMPYWPGPWEPPASSPSFQTYTLRVLACCSCSPAQRSVWASSPLPLSAACDSSASVPPASTSRSSVASSLSSTPSVPFDHLDLDPSGVAVYPRILLALYYLAYGFGGPGFSIPMGLLMAGVSVSAALTKSVSSWPLPCRLRRTQHLHLVFPQLLFLIPLARFPGSIWIIAVGFLLPNHRQEHPFAVAA